MLVRFKNFLFGRLTAALLLAVGSASGAITVGNVQPVNVTPTSFTVLWSAGEPASPWISVYSDATGTNRLSGQLGIEPFPLNTGDPTVGGGYERRQNWRALRNKTKGSGFLQIQVSACQPNTSYYIRLHTISVDGQEILWPPSGPLPSVKTAVENSFVAESRQLIITLPGNVEGRIVTLSSTNAAYPLSAVVGDGVDPNQAFFNLSDLFALVGGKNFTPLGDQELAVDLLGPGGLSTKYTLNFSRAFAVAAAEARSLSGEEYLTFTIGSTITRRGEAGQVNIDLDTAGGAASLVGFIQAPPGHLSDLAIDPLVPELGSASIDDTGQGSYVLQLNAASGRTFLGKQTVARLKFNAVPNKHSAFVPLRLTDLFVAKANTTPLQNIFGESGRIVVLGNEPLLETRYGANQSRTLMLYGKPGIGYDIQRSVNLSSSSHWRPWVRVGLTGFTHEITGITELGPMSFFRAIELGSAGPVVDLRRNGSKLDLVVFGKPNTSYSVQSTPSLSGVVTWTPLASVSLTNGWQTITSLAPTNRIRFYRASQP